MFKIINILPLEIQCNQCFSDYFFMRAFIGIFFSVEITRDFGIRVSCPDHQIFMAISAAATHVGLYHPEGRFYNCDSTINIQVPYIDGISR